MVNYVSEFVHINDIVLDDIKSTAYTVKYPISVMPIYSELIAESESILFTYLLV